MSVGWPARPTARWLNRVQAVGKGQRSGHELVYELYALR